MEDYKQELDTLKKKINTFLDMCNESASRKGDWPFTVKKKNLENELRELSAPPPPPKQTMIEWLAQ